MTWDRYRRWIGEIDKTDEYRRAGLEIQFTEELCRVMAKRGISRAELARRAGTSPAYITKILRGSTNFTLATMAKLAQALGMEVRLHLAPRGSRTIWKDELSAPETWPERRPPVQRSLDGASAHEEPAIGVAKAVMAAEPAQISMTVLPATLEEEGEIRNESSTDQAA